VPFSAVSLVCKLGTSRLDDFFPIVRAGGGTPRCLQRFPPPGFPQFPGFLFDSHFSQVECRPRACGAILGQVPWRPRFRFLAPPVYGELGALLFVIELVATLGGVLPNSALRQRFFALLKVPWLPFWESLRLTLFLAFTVPFSSYRQVFLSSFFFFPVFCGHAHFPFARHNFCSRKENLSPPFCCFENDRILFCLAAFYVPLVGAVAVPPRSRFAFRLSLAGERRLFASLR